LGKEVTNDEKYYNAYLSNNPFTKWWAQPKIRQIFTNWAKT
jgi:hypothetical protein